jgi:sulfur carrier protein
MNGESHEVEDGLTLQGLFAAIGVGADEVAVEHNGEVVARASYAALVLRKHDRLEIVRFMGGG